MLRLYYWFKGVDPHRPGGPWWYRDFNSAEELKQFLHDVMPFLESHIVQLPTEKGDSNDKPSTK